MLGGVGRHCFDGCALAFEHVKSALAFQFFRVVGMVLLESMADSDLEVLDALPHDLGCFLFFAWRLAAHEAGG